MHTTQHTDLRLFLEPTYGNIWFAGDSGSVTSTNQDPQEFVSRRLCDTETVRLLGLPSNAALIAWLYQSSEQEGHPHLAQVGTPAVCNKQQLQDPAQAMFQMQEVDGLPRSKGGWRKIDKHDFASALVQCAFQEGKFDNIDDILASHPAWAAISFNPTMDLLESARLLAEIRDPRWFVDTKKPERFARLRSYLGLTQRNIRYVCGWDHENHGPGFNFERCKITLNAWLGSNNARHTFETDPRDFLRRRVRQYPVKEIEDTTKAILRGLTMYVNFIRLVWLETASPHGGELFAADHFFASDSEHMQPKVLKAWKKHVADLHT